MTNIEIPLGKRTKLYRFFEMLPAILSYGAIILLIVLSLVNPLYAAIYLLLIIITVIIKAVGVAVHTVMGYKRLGAARKVDWYGRLLDLEDPRKSYKELSQKDSTEFGYDIHQDNLERIVSSSDTYPKPSEVYNVVIVAAYNESIDVLKPTMESLLGTSYDNSHMIITLAYEERGGVEIEKTVLQLQKEYGDKFRAFIPVKHPKDLPDEVIGKGGNITFAGRFMDTWLKEQNIPNEHVLVTTLDSDNRPHRAYFDYATYEFIVNPDRKHLAFQPISLYLNNIWDVPAPMRVVATGNSFWNVIVSQRPHMLRNFASHSQPMDALSEMDFWSTRTIVEDGHQYWRSYFHFDGDYEVVPIYVPISQDAVLSDTLLKTLKAQFVQLRRWAYGASDIAYVSSLTFNKTRKAPLFPTLARLIRLIDGHVTWAVVAIMVTAGGWVPILINGDAYSSIAAHQLPEVISGIHRVGMIGLFITIFLSFKMLPPRPARYKRHRSVFMVLQWVLMPVTSIAYSSAAAFTAQTALFLGKYFDKFDVTDKAVKK